MRGSFIALIASLFLLGCPGGGSSGGLGSSNFLGDNGDDGIPPAAHSPEPATILLLSLGVAGIIVANRKKSGGR